MTLLASLKLSYTLTKMPAPKDPIKRAAWLAKLSSAAKLSGLGKTPKLKTADLTDEQRSAISARAILVCTIEEREKRSARALEQGFGKSNKGRKLSSNHKALMVAALKGRTYEEIYGDRSAEQKLARKLTNIATYAPRRKAHTRNKHGADYRYTDWRSAVFKRDDYTCEHCKTRGGVLHAHHIKPWATNPDYRYDVANGLTLCEQCHRNEHARLLRLTTFPKSFLTRTNNETNCRTLPRHQHRAPRCRA